MEATPGLQVDRACGIERSAFTRGDRRGWFAQWRLARTAEAMPAFSYLAHSEHFDSENEVIQFIRHCARHKSF